MDDLTQTFVSPYGALHRVQRGVNVTKPRSLKDVFVAQPDSSEYDLNPESCHGLKMRLLRDAT